MTRRYFISKLYSPSPVNALILAPCSTSSCTIYRTQRKRNGKLVSKREGNEENICAEMGIIESSETKKRLVNHKFIGKSSSTLFRYTLSCPFIAAA